MQLPFWLILLFPSVALQDVPSVCFEELGQPPPGKEWNYNKLYSWAYHHTEVVARRKGIEVDMVRESCRKFGQQAMAKWM